MSIIPKRDKEEMRFIIYLKCIHISKRLNNKQYHTNILDRNILIQRSTKIINDYCNDHYNIRRSFKYGLRVIKKKELIKGVLNVPLPHDLRVITLKFLDNERLIKDYWYMR